MGPRGTGKRTLDWLRLNVSAEIALRSLEGSRVGRLRYEDFAADPMAELTRLSTELGVPVNEKLGARQSLTLSPKHLIAGNPVRYRREVTITPDNEWLSAMPRSKQVLIGVMTAPLMLKYGYGC